MDANFFLQNKKFVKFYNIYKYIINIISNYSIYIYKYQYYKYLCIYPDFKQKNLQNAYDIKKHKIFKI